MITHQSFAGKWRNERGSVVTLKVNGTQLSGTYQTAAGSPKLTDQFEVVGVVYGELVSFSVAWVEFGTLTAWIGRLDPETDTISTLWHMVRSHSTGFDEKGTKITVPVELWNAFATQASRFTRLE